VGPRRGGARAGRDYTLTFGAAFDARFRMMLDVRGGRVTGGRVLQGGGVFDVTRVGRLDRANGVDQPAPVRDASTPAAPAAGR
jgi:hypothetical protein